MILKPWRLAIGVRHQHSECRLGIVTHMTSLPDKLGVNMSDGALIKLKAKVRGRLALRRCDASASV